MLQRAFGPIVVAVIGLFGAASALADHDELTADQLKQTFVGSTAKFANDNGVTFEMRFEADGSAKMKGDNRFSDTGTWSLDEDRFCSQWKRFRGGEKACWRVKHLKSDQYRLQESEQEAALKATITN